MKLKSLLLLGTAATVGLLSFSSIASATTIPGTIGVSALGQGQFVTSGSPGINTATSFTGITDFSYTGNIIVNVPATFTSNGSVVANSMFGVVPLGSIAEFHTGTITIDGVGGFFSTPLNVATARNIDDYLVWGDGSNATRFDFHLMTITFSVSSDGNHFQYTALGTFTDTDAGHPLGVNQTAEVVFSANLAGAGALSYSASFFTPSDVPEPESLSLLGAGLLGLGAVGAVRRRNNKSA